MSETKTYEDGLLDGKIQSHEDRLDAHSKRMDGHSARLRILERVAWAIMGTAVIIQFWPALNKLFN